MSEHPDTLHILWEQNLAIIEGIYSIEERLDVLKLDLVRIEAKLDRLLPIADVLEQVGEGGFSLPKLLGALAGKGG